MLGAIAVASQNVLADWERHARAPYPGVADTPIGPDEEYISIRVRALTCPEAGLDGDFEAANYGVRIGVANGGAVSRWFSADVAVPSSGWPGRNTILAAGRSGELVFAVGPLSEDDEIACGKGSESTPSVVTIDGETFAIVHREPVRKLIARDAREKKSIEFDELALGIQGRIDLRHVT